MVRETEFYDVLGVAPTATKDQIRRAYYQRAKECHPDRHPGDVEKEAEFKAVSNAYQVLFDDGSRSVYDIHGKEGLNESTGFADARDMFTTVFGGTEFEPYVGVLRLRPRDYEEDGENEFAELRRQQEQRERVYLCAQELRRRLEPYVSGGDAGRQAFVRGVEQELAVLREGRMGEPMVNCIGHAYIRQTKKVLAQQGVGIHQLGNLFEDGKANYRKWVDATVSVTSALTFLHARHKLEQDAKRDEGVGNGKMSREQHAYYEANAKTSLLRIVWTVTKADIEGTLLEVIQDLLPDESSKAADVQKSYTTKLSPEGVLRAEALLLMGSIFARALDFEDFLKKSEPPTTLDQIGGSVKSVLRRSVGVDVDGAISRTDHAMRRTQQSFDDAATAVGTAINYVFGFSNK